LRTGNKRGEKRKGKGSGGKKGRIREMGGKRESMLGHFHLADWAIGIVSSLSAAYAQHHCILHSTGNSKQKDMKHS